MVAGPASGAVTGENGEEEQIRQGKSDEGASGLSKGGPGQRPYKFYFFILFFHSIITPN